MENVSPMTETRKELSEAAYLKQWPDTLLIDMWHWWNGNGRGKVMYCENNLSYCHLDYNLATLTGL
jgi:hypothetical protein